MNIYDLVLYFDERTCEIEASHVTDDRLKIQDALVYAQRRGKKHRNLETEEDDGMMATSVEREETVISKQMLLLLQ